MRPVIFDASFERFVARHFGERGRTWLDTLLPVIERYASGWDLTVENFLPGGLTSCCVTARNREQRPVVLKINGPWTSTALEAAALRYWSPCSAPELLMADETCGVLLLERVIPGERFSPVPDDEDVAQVARLICGLHAMAPDRETTTAFPSLGDVVEERIATARKEAAARSPTEDNGLRPRLERAREVAATLLGSRPGRPALLHGDLEDRNILTCARRGLVAIDPVPCLGDPAYDAAYWAVEGQAGQPARWRAERIAAHLGLDPHRVLRWAAVVGLRDI
ncbi:MAG TPA: aminoglycoside phosphotransferase family protein [Streptosporangiaceae bacterium]|nr:aminoglycoside phosphotransferase family protein [Streptosporangiaceae bacterium]